MKSDIKMPDRIARLPIAPNGFPTPWFVEDAKDFRVIDFRKIPSALIRGRCWICGDALGSHRAWSMGTLSALQMITTEPPSHRDCLEYAMQVCPFLANPSFRRSPRGYDGETTTIEDTKIDPTNRGFHSVWVTKSPHYRSIDPIESVIKIAAPVECVWYTQGRLATFDEVSNAIEDAGRFLESKGINTKQEGVRSSLMSFSKA